VNLVELAQGELGQIFCRRRYFGKIRQMREISI